LDKILQKGLDLGEEEKEILKNSWTSLKEKKFVVNSMTKSGVSMLFEEFFKQFTELYLTFMTS